MKSIRPESSPGALHVTRQVSNHNVMATGPIASRFGSATDTLVTLCLERPAYPTFVGDPDRCEPQRYLQTMFDARRKLRAALVANGHLGASVPKGGAEQVSTVERP
jgi:hypothetical protein